MKKILVILFIFSAFLVVGFLATQLSFVFNSSFLREELLTLQQKNRAMYVQNDFLTQPDERENSLYFLFSREKSKNDDYLVIPRFKVVKNNIHSVMDIVNKKQGIVRFQKIQTIPLHMIVEIETNYSFNNSYSIFHSSMNDEQWAKGLSFLFEDKRDLLVKKYWSKLWFLNELRNLLDIKSGKKYDIFQLGNRSFCFVFDTQMSSLKLFTLGEKELSLYQLEGESLNIKETLLLYFSKMQWFDTSINLPFPESKKNFTVYTILDFFTFEQLLPKHREMIEEYTIEYFRTLLRKESHSIKLRKVILSSLKEIKVISTLKDKKGKTYYSEAFRLDLQQLLHTLREFK